MVDKIYEKLKEDELQTAKRFNMLFGANHTIINTMPKKNLDLQVLLKKVDLIPQDCKKLDTINEFYEYLFKLGLETGIGMSKKMIIDSIKNGEVDFEEIMKVNPDDYVKYNREPTYIKEMKESIYEK